MTAFGRWYERRIFPWINEKLANSDELKKIRAAVLAPAVGRVLEIGFGGGANLPLYPQSVTQIVAVDPNAGMYAVAKPRIAASRIPVALLIGHAEHVPLADYSVDTIVSTLVLCSVANPSDVFAELRRVLKPNGRLLLLEHGLADDPGVARWQQRLNRLENIVACGCNLNRSIGDLVEQNGFTWEHRDRFFAPGVPRTHGWLTTGIARPKM